MCYYSSSSDSSSDSRRHGGNRAVDLLATPTNLPSILAELKSRHMLAAGRPLLFMIGPSVLLAVRSEEKSSGNQQNYDTQQQQGVFFHAVAIALENVKTGNCASLVISGCSGSGE
jgi:hypothetical protein